MWVSSTLRYKHHEYGTDALAQYQVAYEPDERHIRRVTEVQLFETRYPSPQPYLDGLAETEWHAALRLDRPGTAKRRAAAASQLPLFDAGSLATG